jgi:hypothetical protein
VESTGIEPVGKKIIFLNAPETPLYLSRALPMIYYL